MARDPLFWIATTVRGLVKRVDELNAMLVKAGPPGVHLAEALFVFDPNAPEFVPKQCKPEDVPSIPPGVHVRADPPLVFHSALEHAEAVLQELLPDGVDRTDVPHVAPQDLPDVAHVTRLEKVVSKATKAAERQIELVSTKLDLHSASIRDLRDLICHLREIIGDQQHHLGSIAKALLTIDATDVKHG